MNAIRLTPKDRALLAEAHIRWEAEDPEIALEKEQFRADLKNCSGTNRVDAAKLRAKAERIAWRQLLLWVKAQNAMIETGMVAAQEVYMAYAIAPGSDKTMFEC